MPVDLRLEAFNPLIPGRADDSGLPVAVLRWVAANPSDVRVGVSFCAALANFIGTDGKHGQPRRNVNRWCVRNGLRGLDMRSDGVPADAEQWGTLALTVLDAPDQTVTARTAWYDVPWGDALLDFWDDFSADGQLGDRPPGDADSPTASLAAAVDLEPGEERAVTFLLAWHFPNRLTWDVMRTGDDRADWVGNHYATRVPDAWAAAEAAARPSAGPRARHGAVRARVLRRRHPRRDQGSRALQSQHPALPDLLPHRRWRLLRLRRLFRRRRRGIRHLHPRLELRARHRFSLR